ncbi:MAG: peptidase M48 Ste24p, partial [Bauldia sp.]
VELTKNPDAMIGALRKIAGHSEIAAPAQIQEMFLDHPRASGLSGLFATHPPIEDRIAALVRFAGGSDRLPSTGTGVSPQVSEPAPGAAPPATFPGPWADPHP